MKTFTKIAMSKPVGKVLGSSVGKAMVKVGNTAIKIAKAPGNMVARAVKIESTNAKRKDDYYRANAPVGAYGGKNTGAVKFPSNVKVKK